MKLYHAGKEEIRKPDLHRGRKNADFGQGFYLTPDREFACRWAYKGYVVNEYELDLTGLNVISFSRKRAWFDYIFKNRRSQDTLTADIVTGPVANDTLYDTLGIISSGFLKPEDALALLQIGPVFTQTAVNTVFFRISQLDEFLKLFGIDNSVFELPAPIIPVIIGNI